MKAVELATKLIGQDNVITIPRLFVKMTGSYDTAAFLCQCMYWYDKMGKPFYKTDDDWGAELSLTPKQLHRVRKECAEYGLEYKRMGIPAKMHYSIDLNALNNQLCQTAELDVTKWQNLTYPNGITSTHQTAELIQETTSIDYTVDIKSFYENDALDIDEKKTPELDDYYNAWNNYCGSLPKVRNNREAEKLIKRELKNRTSFELVEAIQMGARVVSADPFWQKNKYGLVNLLRHLDSKLEVNESNGGFVGADATAFSLASGIWDAVK